MLRLIMPLFFITGGIVYVLLTFASTRSRIGDPNAPLYFPLMIGFFLIFISIVYFIQEWRKRKEDFDVFKVLVEGRVPFLLISTLILIILYTFIFEKIGFLISTTLFLMALLFIINGRKQWIKNIIISVLFSFISWYGFSELLKVSLP